MIDALRVIPDPPGIREARTLPASWYADMAFFEHERQRVFRSDWVCAGVVDDLPAAGAWTTWAVGGTPVLVVRDKDLDLRAFLNVCRHRAAPLCEQGEQGAGSLIRCPYHAWLYRLDGSLAKAQGVGEPADFELGDHSLVPVGITTWRRLVFVTLDNAERPLELGRLADAIEECPLESMELALRETDARQFNWKVLLENYSENYHTPFVHPEIDTTSTEDYPMVSEGRVLYAWDRLREPGADEDEQIRSRLLPGEPGWGRIFSADTTRPYDVGSYLTVWPNVMLNVFPDAVLVMWMAPASANETVVERRLYVAAGQSRPKLSATLDTHRLVHDQDIDICLRVQRSHDAGLDANGRLATVEERGVFFIHEHLRAALGSP